METSPAYPPVHEPAPWPHSLGAAALGALCGGVILGVVLFFAVFLAVVAAGIGGLTELGDNLTRDEAWDFLGKALGFVVVLGLIALTIGLLATAALHKLFFRMFTGRSVGFGRAIAATLAGSTAGFVVSAVIVGADLGILGLAAHAGVVAWMLRSSPPALASRAL